MKYVDSPSHFELWNYDICEKALLSGKLTTYGSTQTLKKKKTFGTSVYGFETP